MSFKNALILFLFIAAFVLSLDISTKRFVFENIPLMYSSHFPYGGIGFFQNFLGVDFSVVHAVNTGAAWGTFSHYQMPLLIARIGLILALIGYLLFSSISIKKRIAFCFVTAGALGNVVDYFIYHHVVDMFLFSFQGHHFPVFNIADSFIFLGICYLFIEGLFPKKSEEGTPVIEEAHKNS